MINFDSILTRLKKQGRAYKWCTPMDPHIWPGKSRTFSSCDTFSSYVRILDVALKTYQRRWTTRRSGERESGISVQAAWHDDDDDFYQRMEHEQVQRLCFWQDHVVAAMKRYFTLLKYLELKPHLYMLFSFIPRSALICGGSYHSAGDAISVF